VTGTEPRALRRAMLVLAALALAWGTNWPVMKIVFAEIPVWGFRAFSCSLAGALILLAARIHHPRLWPDDPLEWRRLAIAGFLNVTIWQITVGYGVQILSSGHAAALAFTMPLWSSLLGVAVLGERLTPRVALALAMGAAGIVLLSLRGGGFIAADLPGIVLLFAAAIGWAIGTHYLKGKRFTLPTIAVTAWQLLLGSVPIVLVWPLLEPVDWPRASAQAWWSAGYITFVSVVIGYIAWFRLAEILPVHIASLATLAVPCVAMLTGAVVLSESLGMHELLALALIVGALGLVLVLPALARPRRAEGSTR
jgi:drug/metabolite transporter (DMT)-like permease